MPWILNHKKIICIILFAIIECTFLFVNMLDISIIILAFMIFVCAFRKINKYIRFKINLMSTYFLSSSEVRNVDYLIIGDMCKIPEEIDGSKKVIQLLAPKRSLKSSYEILRHTHSILRDDGNANVIIIFDKENNKFKEYSLFDAPFLHYTTIQINNLQKIVKKARCPLLYAPIRAIWFISGIKSKSIQIEECPNKNILDFCLARGYKIHFYTKKNSLYKQKIRLQK